MESSRGTTVEMSYPQAEAVEKSGLLIEEGKLRKSLLLVVLVAMITSAGCSTESDVRSDSGPATTATETTDAESPDAAGDQESEETTTTAPPAGPTDSPYLFIQGSVEVPAGEAGELGVVFIGTPEGDMGSTVPVIVRNNTDKAIDSLEVNGTARAADGSLAGSGSSQGFEPAALQPGEWGFGYVYFETTLPADAAIEATARADNVDENDSYGKIQVKVNELNYQPGEYGSASYIGILNNDSDDTATDPVSVYIGCFDGESNLLDVFSGYTDGEVVAGGTASFSVEVYEAPECAAVVVGASGWSA